MFGAPSCQLSRRRGTLRGVALLPFLPPLAWTLVIAWFSQESWSSQATEFLLRPMSALLPWLSADQARAALWLVRKAAHVTEYSVLAVLWGRALAPRLYRGAIAAFGLSALTAILDELHQATTRSRTGSPFDVLLDSIAAAAALGLLIDGWAAIDVAISGLFWIGAAGGTAMIAINCAAGAPSGWLWASVPLGWIAIVVRKRIRRPPRPSRSSRPPAAEARSVP